MGFWNRIPGFGRKPPADEGRVIRSGEYWGRWERGDDLDAAPSPAGVRVNRQTAMQLSAVWACVSLISDSTSTLPLDSFVRREGVRRPFRPRPRWVDEPNPEQSRGDWVGQQMVSLLLEGTAYVLTVRGSAGQVLEAWNVDPQHVTPRREAGQVVYDVTLPETGERVTLDRTRMFHIPAMSVPGQLRGLAPLEAARHMLGAGIAAQQFAERFYGQGLNMAGVIELDGDLDPEDAKALKEAFARGNSGLRNAGLPGVLTAGAKWNATSVSPEQAQFLETRSFSVTEIARFFRCPPHLIADVERSTSWGTGIEQQSIGFVTYTLRPWLERLEAAYTKHLLMLGGGAQGVFVKFNVNGLLRGDLKTRYDAYATGRQWGWLSADDIRAKEDEPPLPDGRGAVYLTPLNMGPAGEQRAHGDRLELAFNELAAALAERRANGNGTVPADRLADLLEGMAHERT